MKILITGFDPFGGESVNPAFEAVKLVADFIGDAEIIKLEIPTVFRKSAEVLKSAIEKHNPYAVLCIGQAGGRFDITVEKVAINLMDGRIPDNEAFQPIDEVIQKDGETAYFATVPVKSMTAAIREAGIPASVSYTAGTYVCNYIMYELLYMVSKSNAKIKGGFIHVPYATGQAVTKPANTPTMSLENIAKAIEASVSAVIKNETDIKTAEGNTH